MTIRRFREGNAFLLRARRGELPPASPGRRLTRQWAKPSSQGYPIPMGAEPPGKIPLKHQGRREKKIRGGPCLWDPQGNTAQMS